MKLITEEKEAQARRFEKEASGARAALLALEEQAERLMQRLEEKEADAAGFEKEASEARAALLALEEHTAGSTAADDFVNASNSEHFLGVDSFSVFEFKCFEFT